MQVTTKHCSSTDLSNGNIKEKEGSIWQTLPRPKCSFYFDAFTLLALIRIRQQNALAITLKTKNRYAVSQDRTCVIIVRSPDATSFWWLGHVLRLPRECLSRLVL